MKEWHPAETMPACQISWGLLEYVPNPEQKVQQYIYKHSSGALSRTQPASVIVDLKYWRLAGWRPQP